MRQKKVIAICLCAAIALAGAFPGSAFATADSLSKQINELNKKASQLDSKLASGKKKEKELTNQINSLNKDIEKVENQVDKLNANISSTESLIAAKTKALAGKQKQIDAKNEVMNQRLRVMYKNGDMGLIEILLGSNNFSELLSNLDMVRRIYKQDADMISYLKTEYGQVQKEKSELQQLKTSLAEQKQEVNEQQHELEKGKAAVNEVRKDVRAENKEIEKQIDSFNKMADQLTDQLSAMMSKDKTYEGGKMLWPAPGYTKITSPYGNRLHPILKVYKMHTGVDIGVPKGKKIVAASDGVVILASWYSGYGNCVIVDHGGGIATLYAHNTSLSVSKGDKVKRGQQVAISGSTGNSTGPHLHFEVRVNGKYQDPMGYLK